MVDGDSSHRPVMIRFMSFAMKKDLRKLGMKARAAGNIAYRLYCSTALEMDVWNGCSGGLLATVVCFFVAGGVWCG